MESSNPIIEWYSKDKWLSDLLVSIDKMNLSDEDAAREAFYRVSDHYNLPKFPEDVFIEEGILNSEIEKQRNKSVFEQLGIIKRMHSENTLKASVLLALLYVYKKFFSTIDEAASEYYGDYDGIPEVYYACFFGKDVDVELRFSSNEKSNQQARLVQKCYREQ